jgi:AraC family transcriptional regulator
MTDWKPEIRKLSEKKLVGMRISMSIANDNTPKLWRTFAPRHNEITNNVHGPFFSLRVYPAPMQLDPFDPGQRFDRWAALEVRDDTPVPDGLESFLLPGGLYAVFQYRGSSSDTRIFQYIFGEWLTNAPYVLDHRPQFELLGEKYANNSADSEEEIWIPIARRNA